MLKRHTLAKRKGFTLVEVALAVAVGLIVIGGAILAFNAVKENASNSNAQARVLAAFTVVEEYSGNNSGMYPTSAAAGGTFSALWASKQGDAANDNPWGGATGAASGAVEVDAGNFGSADEATAAALSSTPASLVGTLVAAGGPTQAANLIYVSGNTTATPWAGVRQASTMTTVAVKNFAVGICDKNGVPWWSAKGGK